MCKIVSVLLVTYDCVLLQEDINLFFVVIIILGWQ